MPLAEELAPVWGRSGRPQRDLLRWAALFLRWFDRGHPDIGVPVRTGKLLRRSWNGQRRMEDVARRIGVSRSVMDRPFEERYGLTPKAYHQRARIRAAVLHLRGSGDKVEYVARRIGHSGLANFYAVFERCTALTPSQGRELDDLTVQRLLEGDLETSPVKMAQRALGQAEDPRL